MPKRVTDKQKLETIQFWLDHEEKLKEELIPGFDYQKKRFSEDQIEYLRACGCQDPRRIGFGKNQIRPGREGRIDVLRLLRVSRKFNPSEGLALAALTLEEI